MSPATRIAAIYDVHGNLPALQAVLAEVREARVDRVVVGGDVVPGPMPRESLAALLTLDLPTAFIHGNGEPDVLALHRGEPARAPEAFHEALRWNAAQLTEDQRATIATWPMTTSIEVSGLGTVLFCHATPRNDTEIFTERTPEERLAPIFTASGVDIVVCGHTHMQFDRAVGGVRVVNAGSVGMPFGDPGAYWLLLGPEDLELRRTDYDQPAAAAAIAATGYPGAATYEIERPAPADEMVEIFEAAALRA